MYTERILDEGIERICRFRESGDTLSPNGNAHRDESYHFFARGRMHRTGASVIVRKNFEENMNGKGED